MKAYLAYLVVFSLIAFFTYADDKRRAVRGAWRVPENLLLGLSFFGGGVGGYLAMYIFRHKTRKVKFHVVHILALLWQAGLLLCLIKDPHFLG